MFSRTAAFLALLALPTATTFGPHASRLARTQMPRGGLPSTMSTVKHPATGPFAPLVMAAKEVMGVPELNKLRGKAIAAHTNVITSFVGTHDTPLGREALNKLFELADANQNGSLEPEELKDALRRLGFSHLSEGQIEQIFARADADENGALVYDEFTSEAPKTLRTNLIKLAKQNGAQLGFLA